MANPNPSPKDPRISSVLEPREGFYVVVVRMSSQLAKDYPDDPWLTDISEIGLATKDSSKYPDYKLVDVQEIKGTTDHYWIFQKFPGPLWYTRINGTSSLVPAKFKRFVSMVESRQDVVPTTEPDQIAGDLISSTVKDQDETGKAIKVNITEVLVEGDPLEGQLFATWGTNTTWEALVADGTPADNEFGIKSSTVTPLGNGKSIKSTERYPDDIDGDGVVALLYAEEHDEATNAIIEIEKRLVDASRASTIAAGLRTAGYYSENKPIDTKHTINISAKIRELPATQTWNETAGIKLPNILTEVGVIWDSNVEGGSDASGVDNISTIVIEEYSWTVQASARAQGFVTGRPYTKVKSGITGNADVQVVRTFHFGPPAGIIAARSFQSVYGYITINGEQKNSSLKSFKSGIGDVNTTSGSSGSGSADSKLVLHQFGPVEYVTGLTLQHLGDPPSATDQFVAVGGSTPSGGLYPAAVVGITVTGSATLEIPDSTTPLTTGETYILKVIVRPWRLGYWIKEVYTATVP